MTHLLRMWPLIAAATFLAGASARAQTVTKLYDFRSVDAINPVTPLVQGSDGNFYGTTPSGGSSGDGTVFKVTASGQETIMHSFRIAANGDGGQPNAALVEGTDGNFYGTTAVAGNRVDFAGGSIFKITPTGELTTLFNFGTPASTWQDDPHALIEGRDGNFYGTASTGGANGTGLVYKITPSGALTELYSFSTPEGFKYTNSDGAYPGAALIQGADGNFYGTAEGGGTKGSGTIFKITPRGAFKTLCSFGTNGSDGADPDVALTSGLDGDFYGTTGNGGAHGFGTVFKITPLGRLKTLYNFSGGNDGGSPPTGLIRDHDGNFYGTTLSGGANGNGTAFKINAAGVLTTLSSLPSLPSMSVGYTTATLVQGNDGNLYGTTAYGGGRQNGDGNGQVFRMSPSGEFTSIYSFGVFPENPEAPLIEGKDGNFYGTTARGGEYSYGTVYARTPSGSVVTLHSFDGSDGNHPKAALVQGSDGNFYGTTAYSGGSVGKDGDYTGCGTVFKITPAGRLTTLFIFPASEYVYTITPSSLVQGSNGKFYGTTAGGGTNGYGAIFAITSTGELTTLHNFNGSDGASPEGGLVRGNDGDFYGTTVSGVPIYSGTIFKISPPGNFTTLHIFTDLDNGSSPAAALTLGTDGNFYGTTTTGGASINNGTVFRMSPSGNLTTLYSFLGGDTGSYPQSALVEDSDGNFYGTTGNSYSYFPGSSGYFPGTLFKIAPSGAMMTLFHSRPIGTRFSLVTHDFKRVW